MQDSEKSNLLSILEAHGQAFLESFGPAYTTNYSKKRKTHVNTVTDKRRRQYKERGDDESDEWNEIDVESGSSTAGVNEKRETCAPFGMPDQIEANYIFESWRQICCK